MAGLNQHIPFLHLPTLDLNKLELYEVLALSGIGAVYCFEGEHAEMAHRISVDLLAKVTPVSYLESDLGNENKQEIRYFHAANTHPIVTLLSLVWEQRTIRQRSTITRNASQRTLPTLPSDCSHYAGKLTNHGENPQ